MEWHKEIAEALEEVKELAQRSEQAAQIIMPALLSSARKDHSINQQVQSLQSFTQLVFTKLSATSDYAISALINNSIFGRIKGVGSIVEKAIRYAFKISQKHKRKLTVKTFRTEVATLIPQIPDLYGVTILAGEQTLNEIQTRLQTVIALLNSDSAYQHPVDKPSGLIEEIANPNGYTATHIILHLPQGLYNTSGWKDIAQHLGLSEEDKKQLETLLAQGPIRIEIHLVQPQQQIHNLFYASHIAYAQAAKRGQTSVSNEQQLSMGEIAQIHQEIIRRTYTWKPN